MNSRIPRNMIVLSHTHWYCIFLCARPALREPRSTAALQTTSSPIWLHVVTHVKYNNIYTHMVCTCVCVFIYLILELGIYVRAKTVKMIK